MNAIESELRVKLMNVIENKNNFQDTNIRQAFKKVKFSKKTCFLFYNWYLKAGFIRPDWLWQQKLKKLFNIVWL